MIPFKNFYNLTTLGCLLIEVLIFWHSIGDISLLTRAKTSIRWPLTIGEIVSYKWEIRDKQIGSAMIHVPACYPLVNYKYTVKNRTFYNNRIALYALNTTGNDCDQATDEFQAKKKVEVFYDPQNPKISVLWPGTRIENYAHIIIDMLLMIFVVIMAIPFWLDPSRYSVPKSVPVEETKERIKEDPKQEKFWN